MPDLNKGVHRKILHKQRIKAAYDEGYVFGIRRVLWTNLFIDEFKGIYRAEYNRGYAKGRKERKVRDLLLME